MAKVKTWASAGKLAEGSHCLGIWRFYLEADEEEEKDDLDDDDDDARAAEGLVVMMRMVMII